MQEKNHAEKSQPEKNQIGIEKANKINKEEKNQPEKNCVGKNCIPGTSDRSEYGQDFSSFLRVVGLFSSHCC